MKYLNRAAVAAVLCLCFSFLGEAACGAAAAADSLPASSLPIYGRGLPHGDQAELIGSAAHVGFSFTGKECSVDVFVSAGGGGYLQYELDGVYQKRIKIVGTARQPIVITAATTGAHRVWLYKTTEATSGPVYIGTIKGKGLRPLTRPAAPLIEFIGNSITCGAQADGGETPCNMGGYADHHNAYYAYGPRVARALGVNFMLSSVSGIGVYRNWNTDGPAMPQVYEKANLQETGSGLWDFSKDRPAIVSIALGTNDFSHGDGVHARLPFDSAVFVSTYIKFVQLVKSKYPSAQIVLLNSPTVHDSSGILLQHCLTAVGKKIDALYPAGRRVALHFFKPMNVRGCGGHPSVEDHAMMAEGLVPFFKKLL
jgi:hypothetical protein